MKSRNDSTKRTAEFCLTLVVIFTVSWSLNFIWEALHAAFLYEEHDYHARRYVRMVSYVAAVDGLLIVGIYLFVAFLWKDVLWLREMRRGEVYTGLLLGITAATIIEYRKVFILGAWSYSRVMPTVFGIGVSPLLQLSVTGLLACWLTRKILYCSK